MRVRFLKATKDIREGRTKFYTPQSNIVLSRELGDVYVKNGDAIEIDINGDPIVKKSKTKKIEEDGEV